MRTWMRKQAKFVGRIIFANFLKLPLQRYKNIIEEVEGSTLFKKLSRDEGWTKEKGQRYRRYNHNAY